jgi:hypothetical protein
MSVTSDKINDDGLTNEIILSNFETNKNFKFFKRNNIIKIF